VLKKPRFLVNTFFQKMKILFPSKINDLRFSEIWPDKVSKNLGFCYTIISEFVVKESPMADQARHDKERRVNHANRI